MNVENDVNKLSQYWDVIVNTIPLFGAAALVSFMTTSAREIYLERTTKQKILKGLVDAITTGMIATAMSLLLPLILTDVSPAIEFGVAILSGRFGNSFIEAMLKQRFGYVTARSEDLARDDAEERQENCHDGTNPAPAPGIRELDDK